jgi:hypothetical protein
MGPEAASRSELGKCLQFQLLTRPQQEDQSLTCLGNIASSHLKNKNKLTKKQWGQTSAVMPSDSQTTRLSHVVKKAQATGMRVWSVLSWPVLAVSLALAAVTY